jgi:copper chaperone CopZ
MNIVAKNASRSAILTVLIFAVQPAHAEYLKIHLRVYGLDCGLCAKGVAASVQHLPGVKSVDVSLKTGMLDIALTPGNTFKMSDLRARIKMNGFRPMDATATAIGNFKGSSKFEVLGAGEVYDLSVPEVKSKGPVELTFQIH